MATRIEDYTIILMVYGKIRKKYGETVNNGRQLNGRIQRCRRQNETMKMC